MDRRSGFGAIFLILFLDILGFSMVLPFLAYDARKVFGATELTGTLLASVYSLMQFLFVPVWGRLSDRVGRRPVLMWSVFATSLSMSGLGLALVAAPNVYWLFGPRILGGIATANIATASAYIADITPAQDRAKGMGVIGVAFGFGFILGPALGGLLGPIEVLGRPGAVPCFVAGGLSVLNFVWVYFGLKESLHVDNRDTTPRRLVPLDIRAAREAFARPGIAVAVLVNFILVLSFTALDQTFRFFNFDLFGMTELQTGLVLGFVGVVAAFVQGGVVRPLAKRYDESKLIQAGVFVQMLAFIGLVLSASFGMGALYGAAALLALGNGLTAPSVSAYVSKRADPKKQGGTLGTNQAAASLARTFGPVAAGWIYWQFGPRSPYVASAIGMGVATLLSFMLQKTSTQTS